MNETVYLMKKAKAAACQALAYKRFPDLSPYIYSFSVYSSKPNEYTVVEVKGLNFFINNTQILFGERILPVSFYGSTALSFVVPSDLPSGMYNVKAVNITNFYPIYPVIERGSNVIEFIML